MSTDWKNYLELPSVYGLGTALVRCVKRKGMEHAGDTNLFVYRLHGQR